MIKKTLTFIDYNGKERTEDFYFNLTKAELTELELSVEGGLKERLEKIIKEEKPTEIIEHFKRIILVSYGKKSDDGRRFIKNDQVLDEFTQTEAYSDLFMDLAFNTESASAFINGLVSGINTTTAPTIKSET